MGFGNWMWGGVQDGTRARGWPFISSEQAVTGPKFWTKWFPWRGGLLAWSQTLHAVVHRCLEAPLCPWQWEDEAYFISKGCLWRGLRLLCCNCYLAIARFRAEFLNLIALDLWDIPALSTVAFFSNNQLFWIVNKKNAAAKSINLMITQHFLAFWLINQRFLLLIIALYCN